jgi:hypothetical protein
MKKSPTTARVIWTTSHDVKHIIDDIDWEDWQMTESPKPYEGIKYEMQLLVHALDQEKDSVKKAPSQSPIRHFLTEPGITASNIFAEHLDFISTITMYIAFIIVSKCSMVMPTDRY